jgi:hypothetical protein
LPDPFFGILYGNSPTGLLLLLLAAAAAAAPGPGPDPDPDPDPDLRAPRCRRWVAAVAPVVAPVETVVVVVGVGGVVFTQA